jgi:hypothetical protein
MSGEQKEIYRETYRDLNKATNEYTVTVITRITSGGKVSYEKTVSKGTWDPTTNAPVGMKTSEPEKPEKEPLPDTPGDPPGEAESTIEGKASLISIYSVYGKKDQLSVAYEYVYDEDGPTYNITVTNNGTESADIKVELTEAGFNSNISFWVNGAELQKKLGAQTVKVSPTTAPNPS